MNEKFCQSCGMPMEGQEFGTNADGGRSGDYCSYCWENGGFTAAQARGMLWEFFPQLKRWKQA